jgi:transposase-like protein
MAKDQQKTQKDQQLPNMTEDEARAHIEKIRWPNGAFCPHCGSVDVYRMTGESIRAGLHACRDCRGHFTVTVGTVMEDSHLPLATWVRAFHLMASSKKGISALQLQRNLGLGSYRTAWHLAHRIREAMRCLPSPILSGEVQADETYVGASRHSKNKKSDPSKPRKRGRGTSKQPVVVLVETSGKSHAFPVQRVDAATLRTAMETWVKPASTIVTDELNIYPKATAGFADHRTVNHGQEEYVNKGGFHTNTTESWFALLKRGVHGTFHHISVKHMGRYCDEFSFRWNGRTFSDTFRRDNAIQGAYGKRVFLYKPTGLA